MTEVPSWLNKRQPKATWPEWLVAHSIGRPEANGSFMIRTKAGKEGVQARVLPGYAVFEWKGVAYTRPAGEVRAALAALQEACAPPPLPAPKGLPRVAALEADHADRADDTDDISRRLRGEVASGSTVSAPPSSLRKSAKNSGVAARESTTSRGRKFAAPKGMPPSIEMRNPGELHIDDRYQRSIDTGPSRALISKIANEWDWRMCMPLVVSRRQDGLFVIDGQHRLAAAKLRKDIQYLPCCVANYDGVADEAAMFTAINRARRAMNRLDDFHAAQAGANPEALAIAALITGAGFTVSRKTGAGAWAPGEVAFTSSIAKVRRRHGDALAADALGMMARAFPGQRLVAGSPIFTAICAVVGAPPANFDAARLEKALRTFDMPGWASFLSESKGGSDRHKHLREMLLAAYDDARVS